MENKIPTQLYSDYKEASSLAKNDGYLNKVLTDSVVNKQLFQEKFINNSRVLDLNALRTLVGIGLNPSKRNLKVLDVGGGAGYHFHIASIAFPDIDFEWHIIETKSMCDAARRIAKKGLFFHESINLARQSLSELDLIISSSALQYFEDPINTLLELCELKSESIFVTRTPLSLYSKPLVAIQKSKLSENGPGPLLDGYEEQIIEYPITYIPKVMFEEAISRNYDISLQIVEDPPSLFFENMPINGLYGYYCSQKKISVSYNVFEVNEFDSIKPWMCEEGFKLYQECLKRSNSYLEYGSGKSTLYALINSSINQMVSIDSDESWVKTINQSIDKYLISNSRQINKTVLYCDIGIVGGWGEPKGQEGFRDYWQYATMPWVTMSQKELTVPDLILIDGRFRVACFLVSLINANQATVILFDDYTERPEYHVVEKYATLVGVSGRMALFKKDKEIIISDIYIDLMRYSSISA